MHKNLYMYFETLNEFLSHSKRTP